MDDRFRTLNLRLTPELRAALIAAAEADGRTVSGYVKKILADRLTEGGWLKSAKEKGSGRRKAV